MSEKAQRKQAKKDKKKKKKGSEKPKKPRMMSYIKSTSKPFPEFWEHFKQKAKEALEHKFLAQFTTNQIKLLLDPEKPRLRKGCLFIGQDASESQKYLSPGLTAEAFRDRDTFGFYPQICYQLVSLVNPLRNRQIPPWSCRYLL